MTTGSKGLEGVVAADTAICSIDGEKGILSYRGMDIHDLAANATFEEVIFLLWFDALPTKEQLKVLRDSIADHRALPQDVISVMRMFPASALPMDVLRTAVSALSSFDVNACSYSTEAEHCKSLRLVAQIPTVVAAFHRLRSGLEPVAPRQELSQAGNFLYMLSGALPDEGSARAFDIALILHAEHEFNASTFAARVCAATLADTYSAITAAIGTLSGPLHGGANEQVMEMLLKIGDVDKAESYIKDQLAKGKHIPGFGHRVYKTEDPRATHLRRMAEELGRISGNMKWFELSRKIEETVHAERGLFTNVDFYSASAYYTLGIPLDLFTPIFACSRIAGWTAHILEQYADNRLIRPRGNYVGPTQRSYVTMEQRKAGAENKMWERMRSAIMGDRVA